MPTKLRFFVQGPTENPFGAPPPPPPAGPTISTQPTAQSVTVPATATFSVVATGTGALSYQWQVNTGGGTFVDVTGANGSGGTTASFTTVASIIGMNGYSYRVEVTDSNGTTVSNAVGLTVGATSGPPAIIPPTRPSTFDVTITPGQNMTTIAQGQPAGTSYLILNGTHTFSEVVLKDGDVVFGESKAGTICNGQNAARTLFKGASDDVVIADLTIQNYSVNGGPTQTEQAAILSKGAEWDLDPNQGNRWHIHNCTIFDNGNCGVFVGNNTTVTSCEIYGHGVVGIGGAYFAGGLIQGNNIHDNAFAAVGGSGQNGAGMKFVFTNGKYERSVPDAPQRVYDNDVTDNDQMGLWWDIDCHHFEARWNRVSGSDLACIFSELSADFEFTDNETMGGGYGTGRGNFENGSISAGESHHGLIARNTINDAGFGIMIRLSGRGTGEVGGDGYVNICFNNNWLVNSHNANAADQKCNIGTSNISVEDNVLINCQKWGDNISSSPEHLGFSHVNTYTYQNNDVTQSPAIQHYYNGSVTDPSTVGRS